MGSPSNQVQNQKTHANQGVTSQGPQVCQIMCQSKVVCSIFGQFPFFSTEIACFDTTLPWGHHATNSKIAKPMPTKV
jgi:hypothetical protein